MPSLSCHSCSCRSLATLRCCPLQASVPFSGILLICLHLLLLMCNRMMFKKAKLAKLAASKKKRVVVYRTKKGL